MKNSTFTSNNGFSLLRERLEQAVKEKRIKILSTTTLFPVEPNWEAMREKQLCPHCGNKLLEEKSGRGWYCKGKRHGDKKRFYITTAKLFNK